jgi:valyl-tRNA synthetase
VRAGKHELVERAELADGEVVVVRCELEVAAAAAAGTGEAAAATE